MLNKLRMIPLVIALVAGVFAFPPPAKACHFVFCDSTVGLCPDSGACFDWCLNNTGAPACIDSVRCVLLGDEWECKCYTCVPN